jgi:hypothetical protein
MEVRQMFGWFRKKATLLPAVPFDPILQDFIKKWLGPDVLIAAIADSVAAYFADVKAGRVMLPAHKNQDVGVLRMWENIRCEALAHMFGFGKADLSLLANRQQQIKCIQCFLEERPHLQLPQPSGDVMAHTLQAVWQVYVHLSEVGTIVADRETDRFILHQKGNDILTSFNNRVRQVRGGWLHYESALSSSSQTMPEIPMTLIEIIYADVTKKAKSIAFSSLFGPSYERNILRLRESIIDKPAALKTFDDLIAKVMKAKDPDQVSI